MISEGSCDTEDWSNDAENLCYEHWCLNMIQEQNRFKEADI